MEYQISDIAQIVQGDCILNDADHQGVRILSIDSRKIFFAAKSLFLAIVTEQNDGHNYIQDAFDKGVRNFLISKKDFVLAGANFIVVDDVVIALQKLSKKHKSTTSAHTVAIIGSNGKTIIKEWLAELLIDQVALVKSPKSYNSQIGVPLSVWNIQKHHNLAIIEAGISIIGEMQLLEDIVQPDTVIISNIGDAHAHGFSSKKEKLTEKLIMAHNASKIVYCADHEDISKEIKSRLGSKSISWSTTRVADYQVDFNEVDNGTIIVLSSSEIKYQFRTKFRDKASLENLTHCLVFIMSKGYELDTIQDKIDGLTSVDMRLSLTDGGNRCQIVNDSYNADIASLVIALDFIEVHKSTMGKTVVLSEFDQHQHTSESTTAEIIKLLKDKEISSCHLIGSAYQDFDFGVAQSMQVYFYDDVPSFLASEAIRTFENEIILVKGSRKYKMERVVQLLEKLQHNTTLEIDLNALSSNLNYYRSHLKPNVKQIAVIKAEAYGSGATKIAHFLQDQHIDYIAVAYTDEGVALRKSGIQVPIMVLTPDWSDPYIFKLYHLEPQVYTLDQLKIVHQQNLVIKLHLNLDTGMSRLGFVADDIQDLVEYLAITKDLHISSIFSHIRATEDIHDDDNTQEQIARFESWSTQIMAVLESNPFRHILNSGGALRFPDAQYEAVRLGLGLYGIGNTSGELERVHSLFARIIQIKTIKKGQSIGYGNKEIANSDLRVGIIPIGYADGIFRNLGLQRYQVHTDQGPAKILGQISMDMTIIDLSELPNIQENDTIEFFGKHNRIEDMAAASDTITYEILCRIAPRVKRVFVDM